MGSDTNGQPPTIKQIGARLGVSHTTVSRALNNHRHTSSRTKERVRAAARDLGYIRHGPALAMRRARSSLVGLIMPDIQNYIQNMVAKVIADNCAKRELQMVLAVSEDDPELEYRHVLALREAQAAGIIIVPTARPRRETARLLNASLAIQLVRRSSRLRCGTVEIDDREAALLATRHLLDLGHRHLGFIGPPTVFSPGAALLAGFEEALRQAGVDRASAAIELCHPRPSFGREAMARLLSRDSRPTGVVTASSELTLGALGAIQSEGIRVPSDMSLVGYGDPEWFQLWGAGITTVGLPVTQLATTTAALLFGSLESADGSGSEQAPPQVVVSPQLIVRGTTGYPGAA